LISKKQPLQISTKQLIQDLTWVINNPSLLNIEVLGEIELEPLTSEQELRILQLGPLELKSYKLGFYFEALIRLYIEVSENYVLKVANLQVQKDKTTLGEFDFILKNLEAETFEHWEVSIKFYLCHNPKLELEGCCGTQLKDVFQNKISKLKDHQLQLSQSEAGIEALNKIEVSVEKSRGLLKGMIFYHAKLGQFKNEQLNAFSAKGVWMYQSEWSRIEEGLFVVLKKPFLFSMNSYSEESVLTNAQVLCVFRQEQQPMMLASVIRDGDTLLEHSRLWLISDAWFK
jgi:hypothetical protein